MHPRHDLIDIFSTFLTFEADRFSGWVTDARLRRSMQNSLQKSKEPLTEGYWVIYWHRYWLSVQSKDEPVARLAQSHLSAYLQETCYWAVQKTLPRVTSTQFKFSDCFQIAIADVAKILKACDPDQNASLKTYSSVAFGNIIRDALRQRREIDVCNDWSLLLKLSRKRLREVLQNAGLTAHVIARYQLAWSCYESTYLMHKLPKQRQIQRPDDAMWEAIAKLYNTQRQQLELSEPECTAKTLEKWLLECAKQARSYLYPQVASLNLPEAGRESGELQDSLSDAVENSLVDNLINQEDTRSRQLQQSQVSEVLSTALTQLDPKAEKLVRLYYQGDLTQQQIAQQLEMQQYQVSRRLSKIRETLLLSLTCWSQETLHITPTSNVIKDISAVLEEWLQGYYSKPAQLSPKESL